MVMAPALHNHKTVDRGFGVRCAAATAAAFACLLTLTAIHRAHSQAGHNGSPAPLCGQRIVVTSGHVTWKIPACLNLPLDQANPAITRAVVGIHGIDRFANAAFGALVETERAANHPNRFTLVLAPQFLTETERERYHVSDDVPCWKDSRWIQGDESAAAGARRNTISSYRVVDLLIGRLIDRRLFPNLRTIVVAGHSGGGQFVQRYAAGNAINEALGSQGIDIRYVVANPSSYLYLTPERPAPGALDQFAVPAPQIRNKVSSFNNYKYGLDRLNPYMRERGIDRIRSAYAHRKVLYLLGQRDNDPRHPQLDRGKAAMLEGPTRLDRGVAFYRYLYHLYGAEVERCQQLAIVPGVGHNARKMFASDAGRKALFDDTAEIAKVGRN